MRHATPSHSAMFEMYLLWSRGSNREIFHAKWLLVVTMETQQIMRCHRTVCARDWIMKVAPCSYDNSGGELCEDRVVSTRYKPCNAYYKSERQKGVGVVLGE